MWRELLDLVIPPRRTQLLLRSVSLAQLRELEHEDGLPYHEPRVTALVWELKYYGDARAAALGGALLGERLLAAAAEEVGRPLLIPVPMHPARRRERGHNHSELLSQAALKALRANAAQIEYAPEALKRVRLTPTQQGLHRARRLQNAHGTMEAHEKVEGRACIVVDDVTTTGATFKEAERALRERGARSIQTIALARS